MALERAQFGEEVRAVLRYLVTTIGIILSRIYHASDARIPFLLKFPPFYFPFPELHWFRPWVNYDNNNEWASLCYSILCAVSRTHQEEALPFCSRISKGADLGSSRAHPHASSRWVPRTVKPLLLMDGCRQTYACNLRERELAKSNPNRPQQGGKKAEPSTSIHDRNEGAYIPRGGGGNRQTWATA